MAKKYNLEDGIRKVGNEIKSIVTAEGPVFVAIYGNPVSGAASFMKKVQKFELTMKNAGQESDSYRVLCV